MSRLELKYIIRGTKNNKHFIVVCVLGLAYVLLLFYFSKNRKDSTFYEPFVSSFPFAALIVSLFVDSSLKKKKYALELLDSWNKETAGYLGSIRKKFTDEEYNCTKINAKDIESIRNPDNEMNTFNESLIKTLNFFESIAAAYSNGSINKKIIENSLAAPMIRFYIMFEGYLENELDETKRNPWIPYTQFIEEIIFRKKYTCQKCTKCKIHETSQDILKNKLNKLAVNKCY